MSSFGIKKLFSALTLEERVLLSTRRDIERFVALDRAIMEMTAERDMLYARVHRYMEAWGGEMNMPEFKAMGTQMGEPNINHG